MLGFFTLFLYLFAVHIVQARQVFDTKTWIPDTNFDNPKNWDSGYVPCENERAIFPPDGRLVSLLSTSLAVSELVLPLDGQIVFTNNAELRLTGGVVGSACDTKDVRFTVPRPSWYDANNWNVSSWRAFPSTPSSRESVIPHAYRVPCRTDHVTFSHGRSFKVHVETSATVATMSISNVPYNNEEMGNFLVSQTGNLLFPGNPKITINGNGCSDSRGCTCGNDEPQVMSQICGHKIQCPPLECSDPIRPVGHCCQICASYLIMEYDERFKLETLLDLHENYLGKGEFREVLSYTGRTYEDKIQAIFLDGGENKGIAAVLAKKVYDTLSHDIGSSKQYKLRSVNLYSSDSWNAGVLVAYRRGVSAGGIVGIVFAVALIVGGVVGALYIYRKRRIPGFTFARFDANVGRIEVELGTTPHELLQPDDEPAGETSSSPATDKAFDNPGYGKASSTNGEEKTEPEASAAVEEFVENPMFMLFEDKPDSGSTES